MLFFFLFFCVPFSVEISPLNFTLYARINTQWFSELRRQWPNVPWQFAWEFVSGHVPTLCLDSGIVSPLQLHWVKGVRMFSCNLLPVLLAEWPGSFMCHCGNTGVEQTPNKSQHTKLTLERKFCHRSCQDSNSQPFDQESDALANKLSWSHQLQPAKWLQYCQVRS